MTGVGTTVLRPDDRGGVDGVAVAGTPRTPGTPGASPSGGAAAGLESADAAVFAVIALLVCLQAVDVSLQPGVAVRRLVVIVACQTLVGAFQVVHSVRRLRPLRDRVQPFSLLAQAVLTFAPVAVFHLYWGGVADLFIASCLVLLRPWLGWSSLAVIEVVTAVVARGHGYDASTIVYLLTANLTGALPVWGLTRLGDVIGELAASRRRAARMAVDRERQRFSRDLHDLLGYTLSAITLKGELAERLAGTDDGRARRELGDVLALAREAESDVRAIARGERAITLLGQLESARAVLASAGVTVSVDATVATLPPIIDAVLATVVREGVTNMLRHATAGQAAISIARSPVGVVVRIANDGVPDCDAVRPTRTRGGLANLQARLTTVGGSLDAAASADGWFVLTATVPPGG